RGCEPAVLSKAPPAGEPGQTPGSLFADTKPVDDVLESAGITGIADRRVAKCSGGEQQRLGFPMALLSDPPLPRVAPARPPRPRAPRRPPPRAGRAAPAARSGPRSARTRSRADRCCSRRTT